MSDLEKMQCDVSHNSEKGKLLSRASRASLAFWDKIANNHRANFQALNEMLRNICPHSSTLCGALLLITAGNFRKIPFVVLFGAKEDTLEASTTRSQVWKKFLVFNLSVPIWKRNDLDYAQ